MQFLKTVKKGLEYCRAHGLWTFMRVGYAKYVPRTRLVESVRRGFECYQSYGLWATAITSWCGKKAVRSGRVSRKIFYIDHFDHRTSNIYWLKAFQEVGRVEVFDILRENPESLMRRIMSFKPDHIHLGGSVQNHAVSPLLLSDIKKELNCTITVFYGDHAFPPYLLELADVVDRIYITNKTYIKLGEKKGFNNFIYMPCPTAPSVFKHRRCKNLYDVVFIGNNDAPARLHSLKVLAENLDLKVFGNGWNGTGLNYGNAVLGRGFSTLCCSAKICIDILDPKWDNLEAYFSNRLINTLATGSFFIARYTPGLEKVFINRKHLVWYTTEEEMSELIDYYLQHDEERERIAIKGQEEVYQKYTFEKSVSKILSATNVTQEAATIDTCALCGSQDLHPVLIKNGYHLSRCNKCGLIFVTDPPSESELRALYSPAKHYQTEYNRSAGAREQFMVHCHRNFNVFKEFSCQGAVLDVGCSIGGFLSLCTGYERVGLEINEATRKVAQSHFGLEEIYEYTLSEFHHRYPNRRFDYVTLWDVLEHLPDPNQTLDIIRKVLHSEGLLFINMPNADGLFARASFTLRDTFGWYHPDPPIHLFQYDVSTLTQILQKHHFEVLRIVKFHMSYQRKRSVVSLRSPKGWLYLLLLGPVELVSRLVGDGDLVTVVAKKGSVK